MRDARKENENNNNNNNNNNIVLAKPTHTLGRALA